MCVFGAIVTQKLFEVLRPICMHRSNALFSISNINCYSNAQKTFFGIISKHRLEMIPPKDIGFHFLSH
jgi:hypothetical protein